MTATTGLALYDEVARRGSVRVISAYSTSFGLASRLCSATVRAHVADVYALVRVADELVDGPAEEAGLDAAERRAMLDALEAETERAIASGYSPNLVVHAFARTARSTGFGTELTRPFFASMRADLESVDFDEAAFREYVYGSAEVVGLMCLRAFQVGLPADARRDARWERGARHLGAAFQKVNFLRDLAEDFDDRGRRYFPGIDPRRLTEAEKIRILDDIDHDLAIAGAVIPELPGGCRRAVAAAHALFADLSARLRRTPASALLASRVRVPNPRKLLLLARSAAGRQRRVPT
ncbi:phytoene/squalene synthase family protein [Agromyces aerolatus]|uniref:phytoene/squalene synthase family protein n=1 Tax=Agromyces sp. LY-1074 TaxID=3074080 RepID=UPI00285F549A|nr:MULTISPECIES: squalene/phytoene synthase family protein [unclassified Agromyces]MDR5701514.1 squalene/phytoene synthase family protein [Agromyces sp. LY-1074]MDR5707879.1 squalene/phytoene synthase family protein [Agromyces sp. LY-1358]